jgi:serine/threonine protein kinase
MWAIGIIVAFMLSYDTPFNTEKVKAEEKLYEILS